MPNEITHTQIPQTQIIQATRKGDIEQVTTLLYNCPEEQRFNLLQSVDTDGCTALMYAATQTTDEIAKTLLKYCPEFQKFDLLNKTNRSGMTALAKAAIKNNTTIVKLLLEHCPEEKRFDLIDRTNLVGHTVFSLSARVGNTDILRVLIKNCTEAQRSTLMNRTNSEGYNALTCATKFNFYKNVKLFIKKCPEGQACNLLRQNENLLIWAQTKADINTEAIHKDILTILLKKCLQGRSVSLNQANNNESTLIWAVHSNDIRNVDILLTGSAQLNNPNDEYLFLHQKDRGGNTALSLSLSEKEKSKITTMIKNAISDNNERMSIYTTNKSVLFPHIVDFIKISDVTNIITDYTAESKTLLLPGFMATMAAATAETAPTKMTTSPPHSIRPIKKSKINS